MEAWQLPGQYTYSSALLNEAGIDEFALLQHYKG
jgi:hypothetical protein